jgi:hypothetical protein
VTAEEMIGDDRGDPLVKGLAGGPLPGDGLGALGCIGLRERRGVRNHPEPQKSSEGFRQELEVAVLALTQPPVVVDRLNEPVERARRRWVLGRIGQVALDGVFDDGSFGTSRRRAVGDQVLSKRMAEARVDAHAPRLGDRSRDGAGLMNRLARLWRLGWVGEELEKHRSATEVETSVPKAKEASVCIAGHVDGPAAKRQRLCLGCGWDEHEPRAGDGRVEVAASLSGYRKPIRQCSRVHRPQHWQP